MNSKCYEIKKLLFGHKMIYAVIAFQVMSFAMLVFGDVPANSEISNNLEEYTYFLEDVEGKVSKETDMFFEERAAEFTKMESEFQTVYKKISDGILTKEEGVQRIEELEKKLQRKKGFLVLYDQYTDAKVDRGNRYLLNTNAWEAILCNDSLDLILVIFIMLMACVCFGAEISSEMDVLLRLCPKGEKGLGLCKLILVIAVSCLNFVMGYGIKILYYNWKYRFTHGDYPIQSLPYFYEYTGKASLLEAGLGIFLWRVLGVAMWSVIVCALMLFLRRYALVMITAFSGLLLAYIGISKEYLKYYIPGPLGALLGTGFYKGNSFFELEYGEQKVYTFIQLSGKAKSVILVMDILIILVMGLYVVYKYSNCWNRKRVCRARIISIFLIVVLCGGMATGCGAKEDEACKIFNIKSSNHYESDQYLLYYDINEGDGKIMVKDKKTGKTTALIRDAYQENKEISDTFYVDGNSAYYTEITYDKEDKYGANEYDEFSLIEVDLKNFSSRTMFSKNVKSIKKDVFGIKERKNDNFRIYPDIKSFFIFKNVFYFVTIDGDVYGMDLHTKAEKYMFACDADSISFMDGCFYYLDDVSRLVRYDVVSKQEYLYKDIAASDFVVNENYIIYKDIISNNTLMCTDLDGNNSNTIYEGKTYFLDVDQNAVFYIDDDEILHEVDFAGKEIKSMKSTIAASTFIFRDYNKILTNVFGDEMVENEK